MYILRRLLDTPYVHKDSPSGLEGFFWKFSGKILEMFQIFLFLTIVIYTWVLEPLWLATCNLSQSFDWVLLAVLGLLQYLRIGVPIVDGFWAKMDGHGWNRMAIRNSHDQMIIVKMWIVGNMVDGKKIVVDFLGFVVNFSQSERCKVNLQIFDKN